MPDRSTGNMEEPELESAGLTGRVVLGGAQSAGGQIAVLLVSLVATPFVIRLLGPERYGVLVLVQLLLGYLAFADLGMGDATTRFASTFHARGDVDGEVRVIWTGFLAAFLGGAAVTVTLFLLSAPLAQVLGIPEGIRDEAVAALRFAGLLFLARSVAGVANTPLLVRLRLDLYTLITTGGAILQIAALPLVLLVRPTLDAAVGLMATVTALTLVVLAAVGQRIFAAVRRPRFDTSVLGPLARYGLATVGVVFLGTALQNSEKLWLVRFASVTALAYYAVAFTLARLSAIVPGAIGQPLLPAFARLSASPEPLRRLYGRALRLVLLALVPIALLLCAVGEPFLFVWAGPDFARESRVPLYILALAVVIDGMSYVPRILLSALGTPQRILRFQLITVIPYLAVAGLLVANFGAIGAAVAWTLRASAEATLLFAATGRHFHAAGLAARVPATPAILTALLLIGAVGLISQLDDAWKALLVGTAALAAFVGVARRYLVTPDEVAWVRARVREATRWTS